MLMTAHLRDTFRSGSDLTDEVLDVLDQKARALRREQAAVIFGRDNPVGGPLLLISGTVRVQQMSQAGEQTLLYRVHAGAIRGPTPACLLPFEGSSAQAIAETPVEALLIPPLVFEDLIAWSQEFRAFIFKAYSERVSSAAHCLSEHTNAPACLASSHQPRYVGPDTAQDATLRRRKVLGRC
ncbi:MAG: CRP/FNR family transcriptional regulator [Paracoccaceae bacterium]|jgi:CRP/FNR family transcriptional regulator